MTGNNYQHIKTKNYGELITISTRKNTKRRAGIAKCKKW